MPSAATFCHKAISWAGILVFLVCICLPVADQFLDLAPRVELMENDPAQLPPFSLSQASKGFNTLQRGYLEKTFGFRKNLVRLENILDYLVLDSSTHFQSVIKGKGDWLFLAMENNDLNVIEDYRSGRLFTPAELDWWTSVFKSRRDWLAEQGIRYLVVVAPNKHSVYPEFLPEAYTRINAASRTDQLVTALAAADVPVLDLRPVMAEAKKSTLAYYHTDTHWTSHGAHAGYAAIMKRLGAWFPRFHSEVREDFDVVLEPGLNGGLASMLALGNLFPEERVVFFPKTPRRAVESPTPPKSGNFQPTVVMQTNDPALPDAVVIRDSFAQELVPFLSEHFNRVTYLWPYPTSARAIRNFDKETIGREKPAVVIEEFVERYFTGLPPRAKAGQGQP